MIQNKGNWTYEYTDENGSRFYKLYDRQNKHLSVLSLRHYKDDHPIYGMGMDHVNWELWNSPAGCENEDHAEKLLEYYDSGIYGTGFVDCITDSILKTRTISYPTTEYKLHKDSQYA